MTPTRPDTAARWFNLSVTVVCCLTAGWMGVRFCSPDLPTQDEWMLVDRFTSHGLGEWLIEHHNEHRYPVGKAVWIAVLWASGYDFRAPMFVSVGLLTAAAVLLQWAARRLRGHAHPVDALLAVLLLHWGNSYNLYMGFQVYLALFVYGLAGWVWCGVGWWATGRRGWGWGSVAYAVSLLFADGFGVSVTPAVVGWLGYLGVGFARGRRWVSAAAVVLLAAGAAAYTGWAWLTMPTTGVTELHPVRDAARWAAGTADYLSGSTGYWGPDRDGGAVRAATTIAVLAAWAAGLAVAVRWALVPRLGRRPVGVLLLLVLAGSFACGLAVGLKRPGMCLGGRFTTPSAAGLAVAGLAVGAGVRPGRAGQLAAAVGVVTFGVGLQTQTYRDARHLGYLFRTSLDELEADLRAGAPPTVLAGRHGGAFGVLVGSYLQEALPRLKQAGVGVFAGMADDPPFVTVPIDGVTLPPTDPPPEGGLTLTLPPPPPGAFAVQVRMARGPAAGGHQLTCRWADPAGGSGTSVAYSHWIGWPATLVFTFDGRPDGLFVTGFRPEPRVEAVEWLVRTP